MIVADRSVCRSPNSRKALKCCPRDTELLSDPGHGEGTRSGLDRGVQSRPPHPEGLGCLGDGEQEWARAPSCHETTTQARHCWSEVLKQTLTVTASLLSERSR